MSAIAVAVTMAVVVIVLGLVAFALFDMSLFAHHPDQFRDLRTGRPLSQSPHLETRDEYEQTHPNASPHLETRDEFERTHGRLA